METTMRNRDLTALAELLQTQHAMKNDVIVSATAMRAAAGQIFLEKDSPILSLNGVSSGPGLYDPTEVAIEGIASKLGITPGYLKKLHAERVDLFDSNVNGWLHGRRRKIVVGALQNQVVPGEGVDTAQQIWGPVDPDPRKFLLRTFRPEEGGTGIARAFLSDRYQAFDNLDVMTAVLEGVEAAGIRADVRGCDLSDRRMYIRVVAPEVAALAPTLLKGYRSPFSGDTAEENPLVFAGFRASNSEVGDGAWSITPYVEVQVCSNGMTITKDAQRGVHLGGKKKEGVVEWSGDTLKKELDLIRAKCRDMVATFVNPEYLTRVITELEEKAGKPVTEAEKTVSTVGKALSYSEEQIAGVLKHFYKGSQETAGGVMQAVSSYAQEIKSADTAAKFEDDAVRALELAFAAS